MPVQIKDIWHWGGSEWNSIFFYLGDALFVLVLVFWAIRGFKGIKKDWILLLFLVLAGGSLFVSSNLDISVYRFVKLVEFGLLFFYVRSNFCPKSPSAIGPRTNIFKILVLGGLVQAILAIAQFIKQSSLGLGILESGIFRPGIPGVATFSLGVEKIMRAYGSFQHSNVLAGFLLLAIFAMYAILIIRKDIRIIPIIALFVLIFALFLTFSRVALLVFLIMSLVMFLIMILKREKVLKLFGLFLVFCIICIAILCPYLKARFFTISLEEEALNLRFFYNKMAFAMIKEKPFLGVGIGNFVNYSENYPAYLRAASKMIGSDDIPDWLFQPVHNIYLLIGAEIGILGLLVFILFIGLNVGTQISKGNPVSHISHIFLFLLVGFLILGLTDHYFWTLQSGALMFWVALALS